MNTRTTGPWFQGQIKGTEHQIFTSEVGVFIDDAEANPADIAFIVRACNSHEAMLEALKGLLQNAPTPKGVKQDFRYILYREAANKAIRLAEGRV